MARGDHLRVWRWPGFWHHAIDVGNGQVIDYSSDDLGSMEVRLRSYAKFAIPTDHVEMVPYETDECASSDTVVKRAFAKLGERSYGVLTNNCEHICTWCKTGTPYSWQAFKAGVIVGASLTAWLLIRRQTDLERPLAPDAGA